MLTPPTEHAAAMPGPCSATPAFVIRDGVLYIRDWEWSGLTYASLAGILWNSPVRPSA